MSEQLEELTQEQIQAQAQERHREELRRLANAFDWRLRTINELSTCIHTALNIDPSKHTNDSIQHALFALEDAAKLMQQARTSFEFYVLEKYGYKLSTP